MNDLPIIYVLVNLAEETNTIVLTLECGDEATANLMHTEIVRGLKNGTLKISGGQMVADEECGGLQ